tara:strand:+ start:3100 stop:3966 length:867 start_codon:yes stop_codon:yes gene_type:complete
MMHKGENLKKKSIVFLGLTKNSAKTLSYFLNFFQKIKKEYKNCYLIIGENDSTDDTKKILNKLSKKDDNFFLVDTSFAKKFKFRLEKMANLRESLKIEIKKIKKKIDYVCWFDLDDVLENSLSVKKFVESNKKLEADKKLFGLSSNSKPYYYDILSFRKKNFFTKNIYIISLNKNLISGFSLRKKFIYDIQKKIMKTKDIYTISSFNGMCIYYYKYFKISSYLEKKKIMRSQVEHVTFNKKIHNKTKKMILLDKNFVLNLPNEHRPYDNLISFCFGKLIFYFLKFLKP